MSDSVKTEQAKMNDLQSLLRAVGNGVIADYQGELEKIQKKYDQAGFPIMREEVARQFNEYLKTNPYEGQ